VRFRRAELPSGLLWPAVSDVFCDCAFGNGPFFAQIGKRLSVGIGRVVKAANAQKRAKCGRQGAMEGWCLYRTNLFVKIMNLIMSAYVLVRLSNAKCSTQTLTRNRNYYTLHSIVYLTS
jgi:hypothetical protein